ncbi:MAG: helix-turn-helix domain containing protein, partial [Deltaproteobacteria bacterium]|nr:helix-turn-helix domain containing protein [Deltaproteobacteria bacterium]
MPWKIISLVGARQKLVEAVWARHHSIPALARRFGVSRKTVYKWLNRFRRQGAAGLGDRSRRPGAWPHRWAAIWVRRILHWRRHRPHWGAKKIRQRLRQLFPRCRLPCVRSIHRCLQRHQKVRRRRARKGPVLPAPGLTPARRPNHVWTVDFKGWFCTADRQRQEPLTVRDLFSRYGLCLRLLPNQEDAGARRVFARLFGQRGLPERIGVD